MTGPRWRAMALAAVLALAADDPLAVVTRFWEVEGQPALLAGELDGVSLREDGELLLAPDLTRLPLEAAGGPPQPFLWRGAVDRRGNLYVGSGARGIVYRVDPQGESSRFFAAGEPEVHAVAVDRRGRVLVGASPPGRLYRIEPDGKALLLFEPEERYIWDVAVGRDGTLLVATGERGVLYRLQEDGEGGAWFDADDPHILSLAVDVDGAVIAGTSGSGLVLRLPPEGPAEVLLDADEEEVTRVAVTGSGTVYAAVNSLLPVEPPERDDRRRRDEPEERLAGELPSAPAPGPEGLEELTGEEGAVTLRRIPRAEPLRLSSTLYRITPQGVATRLWSSDTEGLHSLHAPREGRVLFGTGFPGRLYLWQDGEAAPRLLRRFTEAQVTGLASREEVVYALTSNPGGLYRAGEDYGQSGTFLSEVRDAGGPARWGRIAWQGEAPAGSRLEVATRSGNSSRPDATWSDWSPAYPRSEGSPIVSPAARYLQFRVRFSRLGGAPSPRLRRVRVSYREENAPPRLGPVLVGLPDGAKAPEEGTPAILAVRWSADDPNRDALVFELRVRREPDPERGSAEDDWALLAEGLRQTEYQWEAASRPGGRYRLKVRASDLPDNDPDAALSNEAVSGSVVVDREPPTIDVLETDTRGGARVRFRVRDAVSPVVRAEAVLGADGAPRRLTPDDGLDDSREETYEASLPGLAAGRHVLELRVQDREGNQRVVSIPLEVSR